jgi:hypothetical protein
VAINFLTAETLGFRGCDDNQNTEQAETLVLPLRVTDSIFRRLSKASSRIGRLVFPVRPIVTRVLADDRYSRGLSGYQGCAAVIVGGSTMFDTAPNRSAILNGLQRRGRSANSSDSTPSP